MKSTPSSRSELRQKLQAAGMSQGFTRQPSLSDPTASTDVTAENFPVSATTAQLDQSAPEIEPVEDLSPVTVNEGTAAQQQKQQEEEAKVLAEGQEGKMKRKC